MVDFSFVYEELKNVIIMEMQMLAEKNTNGNHVLFDQYEKNN